MPTDRDSTEDQTASHIPVEASKRSPVISRRALLRGAGATVPTILTLQSGAALATSSNMMMGTTKSAQAAMGPDGAQCLDIMSAQDASANFTQLDLGPSPQLHVQHIPQRVYHPSKVNPDTGALEPDWQNTVSVEHICQNGQAGGPYWYRLDQVSLTGKPAQLLAYSPQGQQVKAGFLVSSTALTSFASYPTQNTYF